MTDFNAAADFARRAALQNKDIAALGAELQKIGSIEQARAERQAALDAVTEQQRAAISRGDAEKAEHEIWKATRTADLVQHQANAKAIADVASKEAEGIIARAREAARGVVDAANTEVTKIQSAHADAMTQANAALQAVQRQLDDAEQKLEAARTERETVQRSIQDMRRMAQSALGTVTA